MILKRPFLSRRAVLRGAGATLALPLMEIMESRSLAKGAAVATPPVRTGFSVSYTHLTLPTKA